MPFPVVYPEAVGPGRLTEIASFRKSNISEDEFYETLDAVMEATRDFPISRQNLVGFQREDAQIAVLIADWTSAEEKDKFEPGQQYQSIKPTFGKMVDSSNPSFACHHMILPGESTTPVCALYTVSHMTIPAPKQDGAAGALEEYARVSSVADGIEFVAAAASREDPEVVVCLVGYRNDTPGDMQTSAHGKLKAILEAVVTAGANYRVTLKLHRKF